MSGKILLAFVLSDVYTSEKSLVTTAFSVVSFTVVYFNL
jgi:hypothetical protein